MKLKKQFLSLLCSILVGTCFLTAQPDVYFHITNERIVTHPSLGNAYAIDVQMHASYSGTYHSRGLLYLAYDTAKFGTMIEVNNNIAYDHGDLLQGTVNFLGQIRPKYQTVNVIDNTTHIVALTWESDWLSFLPNPLVHNEVPDTLAHLYTLYFKTSASPSSGDISFFMPLMQNQQYMITDVDGDGSPDEIPYGSVNILPVELLDFYGSWNGGSDIELSWATRTENSNSHFIIEKSYKNGTFFPLGKIEGTGNSADIQTYQWIDQTPHASENYYRLRQVDLNGTFSYSDIIQVHVDQEKPYVLFPSPTRGQLFLEAAAGTHLIIQISDVRGKFIKKYLHTFTPNHTHLNIDLASYSDGVYFVQIINEQGQSQFQKIIKSQF